MEKERDARAKEKDSGAQVRVTALSETGPAAEGRLLVQHRGAVYRLAAPAAWWAQLRFVHI